MEMSVYFEEASLELTLSMFLGLELVFSEGKLNM